MRIVTSRLSRNTAALLVSNGGSALLSFGLSVLIGRWLGSDGLGAYVTALAWIFPLSLVAEFGLGTLITRDVAQAPAETHAYLRASVVARVLIGGSVMIACWVAAPLISDNLSVVTGLRLSAPLIVILPFYSSFTAVFRAQQRMLPIAVLNLGMLIMQVTCTYGVLVQSSSVRDVFIVNTLTSAGQLIAAWGVYRWHFFRPSKSQLALRHLLRQAAPFAIAAILAAFQMRLTFIVLEPLAGITVVGAFAAAMRFIDAGRLLPHALFDALFPMLSELAATPARLERTFQRVMLGLVGYGLLFGGFVTLVADPIITLTYGDAFTSAIPTLKILAWALLPLLLKGGRTLYWYARGGEAFVNKVTLFVIVLHMILAWWLIPQWGITGAASVQIIVEIVAFGVLWFWRPQMLSSA